MSILHTAPETSPVARIALTGGPCAGKSVVGREIERRFSDRLVLVPESATHVYSTLGTRWDRLSVAERREVQRLIYRHQVEQEARFASEHPGKILLLDRGTIDGATYWPQGPEEYWRDLGTSLAAELARYDMVIYLETAAALGIYDGAESNSIRFEDAETAIKSGRALLQVWSAHPNIRHVEAFVEVEDKIAAVSKLLSSATT